MNMMDDRFLDVDRHGVLKVPFHLWVGLAYLARHWLILVIALASVRRSPETFFLLKDSLSWLTLIFEIPSLLLLIAGLSRHPQAGKFWAFVWKMGVWIIGLTVAANSGFLVWWLWRADFWSRWPELFLASCLLLDFAILFGVYQSTYIRQIFSEFPARPISKELSS